MLLIFFAFNLLFVIYFLVIKLRWAALIPFIFSLLIIYILSDEFLAEKNNKIDYKKLIIENLSFFGYILINYGLYKLLLVYGNILPFPPTLILLGINIFIFLIAFIFNLKLRKQIFHITIYLLEFILILLALNSHTEIYTLISILSILNFSIYTFIVFIIGSFKKIGSDIKGLWFLLLNMVILLNLYKIPFGQLSRSAFSLQIYLLIIFSILAIIKFLNFKLNENTKKETTQPILNQIINREYPFLPKKEKTDFKKIFFNIVNQTYDFINNLPGYIKLLLGLLNVITIIVQIIIFIKNLHSGQNILENELFYWGSILIFFINFLILKYLNFYHFLQRIFFFFIINFGIYLSILNLFGKNYLFMSIYGILRNLANSFSIFLTSNLLKKHFLVYEDILLWIISNILAIFINIYFLIKTNLIYDLKLAILGVYIGVQLILIYYNFKFLNKVKG